MKVRKVTTAKKETMSEDTVLLEPLSLLKAR